MGASYRKGLVLSLGSIVQTTVDLHAAVPSSKPTGMHRMCPEHKLQLKQTHKCPEGHEVTEFVLGRPTGNGLQLAPQSDKPEFEAADVLELRPLPAKQVDDNTFYGGAIYYMKPHPATMQAWLALQSIVEKGKTALVAKGALRRGNEKMWRVDSFRDYLVLREIVFPEDIRDVPEEVNDKLEKGTVGLITQFLENLETTWESLDTVDRSREQLMEWINSGDTIIDDSEPIDRTNQAASLIDQLQQAVQKTK